MENKVNLIALITILSSFRDEYIPKIADLLKSFVKILTDKPENTDPVLELRIGLHKIFSILILKLRNSETISDKNAKLANKAIQELFHDKNSYQRFLEGKGLIKYRKTYMDSHARELMHGLVVLLLLEAYCDDDRIPERRQIILQLSRGLRGNSPKSLEEIGEQFNMPKDRVNQIKKSSENKIWKIAEETGVDFYF
jgi:DNA-directed RNA polymerase sigma subunit (sigma70/sigma32)